MDKEDQAKILEVNNLRVSFWTHNGTVKAVRGISFNLYRGKTLAIVGESGSGKSVSSRAIMGILAPNKIVEEGEILYDGRDILRLSEEELCKIRGSRIAMIFQDPMSSLNPIMKVGQQITEAMALKQKATIRDAKGTVRYLEKRILEVDPSLREEFAHLKKGEPCDEKKIIAACVALSEKNDESIAASLTKTVATLKDFRASPIFDPSCAHFLALKGRIPFVSAAVKRCENHLLEQKDSKIFTFQAILDNYYDEYKSALKREKAAEKAAKKEAKRVAKGKVAETSDQAIKARAWGSEIDLSHQGVMAKCLAYLDSIIAYLSQGTEPTEASAFQQEGETLWALLKKNSDTSKIKLTKDDFKAQAIKTMEEVGIAEAEKRYYQYPFEFSGGMRQRIVIAIALSSNPEILICDEPTTALDVTIQAQILDLINELKVKRNLSVIFITHNLGVVANMADDIAIMYAGKIVEYGTVDEIFYQPKHPYTWALLSSMPDLDTKARLDAIPGTPPNMIVPPKGDAFAARNKYAMQIDFEEQPPFFKVSDTHYAATWLLDPRSPKLEPPASVRERIARFEKLNKEIADKKALEEKEAKGGTDK
jgi:oligopeptide/dipeptide ABC transporter ATP-binding protein